MAEASSAAPPWASSEAPAAAWMPQPVSSPENFVPRPEPPNPAMHAPSPTSRVQSHRPPSLHRAAAVWAEEDVPLPGPCASSWTVEPSQSFESDRCVRIRSTTLDRLLHGLVLLPSKISGKMNISLDTITIMVMLVVSFLSLCLATYHLLGKPPKMR